MSDALANTQLFPDLLVSTDPVRAPKRSAKQTLSRSNGKQLKMFPDASLRGRNGFDLELAPLDATFRDSSVAPLHSWFRTLRAIRPDLWSV
jgi:hypothetical protein